MSSKGFVRWGPLAVAVAVAGLGVAGCSGAPGPASGGGDKPAKVEKAGSGPARVTLTEQAVKRLDIRTANVQDSNGRKVIPYSSVMYDPQGQAWAFTRPAALTFVREKVSVESISGDSAILTEGPGSGTAVVTVGAAELYGAELGVGK